MRRFMMGARPGRSLVRAVLPVLVVAQLLGAGAAIASPAAPNVVKEVTQPDGTIVSLRLWGDEFAHGWETLGGYTVTKNAVTGTWDFALVGPTGELVPSGLEVGETDPPPDRHLRPTDEVINHLRALKGAPPIGVPYLLAPPPWSGADTDLLFIMVGFTDVGCSFTVSQMQDNMFGTTSSGPGNLEDYYEEISYGDLDIDGTVVGNNANGCVTLANSKAYYDTGAGSAVDVVNEAVAAVDGYVNFNTYDNDANGFVDAMGIIYAGGGPHDGCDTDNFPDGSGGDNLWPHSSGTGGTATNEADVNPYIINSEVTFPAAGGACNQIQTIGLFAHEFGHSLGLPDLYDTNGGSEGTGAWSTMGSQYQSTVNLADTPPHFDPWSKWFEGWITPTDLTGADQVVNLDQVETSGEVVQLLLNPGGAQIGGVGQYFLVENRQLVGFDSAGVGCGVVIWHIDETQGGNQTEAQKLVDVEEADGDNDLDNEVNRGDQGDPFPGNTDNHLFDDTSDPNSDLYGGASSGVRVRVQNNSCASTMQVAVGPNQAPTADADGPYVTNEGTNVGLSGSGSSDADGDPLAYDWDPDAVFVNPNVQNPTFEAVGQDGATGVDLTVTDPAGESDTDSSTVTVNNVAPSVSLGSDTPKDEGSLVTVSGTVSDPGWLDPLSATIDWMDGAGPEPLGGALENTRPDATLAFSVAHRYGDNGLYPVEVCGSDDDVTTCETIDLQIDNVAPTVTFDPAPDTTIEEFDTSNVRVTFSDPGWLDTYTAQVTWGEGTVDNPTPTVTTEGGPGPDLGEASGSHQYGDNGLYPVSFTITDDDTGSGSDGFTIDVANVDPTADIDTTGTVIVNGIETILAHAGETVPFTADSTDRGSDDLLTTWDWDDGVPSPDEVAGWLVNPPLPDPPFPPGSPTVEPRDITHATSHIFSDACVYDVVFGSTDDDAPLAGSQDEVAVLITGNGDRTRSDGWWHAQYKATGEKGNPEFDQMTLDCYLAIARFASDVFDEAVPLSTLEDAHAVLHPDGTALGRLDREILTAWLNFANGGVDYLDVVVDTDGDHVADATLGQTMAAAETVRLNPASTKAQLDAARKLVHQINVPSN